MNSTEFNRWWTDAKTCWPSLDAWIVKHFADAGREVDCLRKWSGVLSDVSLDHALEVNRLMHAGDLPFVGEYDGDKERLPQHVRRLARQLAFERRERVAEQPTDVKPSSFPAGKILRRMAEMAAHGIARDDAMAAALKEFPIGKPTWEPRYRCQVCLDVGSVLVAPPWAVRAMLADCFDKCHHRNASARCKCRPAPRAASKIGWEQAEYDEELCFRVNDSLWPERQVSEFRAWCEAKREEFWNSKRESAFDAFNQREFAP